MIRTFFLVNKPNSDARRQRNRPEHKACLAVVADRIAFAGLLVTDDGQTVLGSLLAIAFESRDAAHACLADEPFTRAGPADFLKIAVRQHVFDRLQTTVGQFSIKTEGYKFTLGYCQYL